jgi:hypothetical protein
MTAAIVGKFEEKRQSEPQKKTAVEEKTYRLKNNTYETS